jgi:hypothetical protein
MEVPQHIMQQLKERKTQICPLEEIALAAPYFCPELEPILHNRDVLHFADNTSANGAASRAYSSAPDLARIVHSLTLKNVRNGTRVWIEYVPSAANIADGPSRPEDEDAFHPVKDIFDGQRIEFSIPPLEWPAGE